MIAARNRLLPEFQLLAERCKAYLDAPKIVQPGKDPARDLVEELDNLRTRWLHDAQQHADAEFRWAQKWRKAGLHKYKAKAYEHHLVQEQICRGLGYMLQAVRLLVPHLEKPLWDLSLDVGSRFGAFTNDETTVKVVARA